VRFSEDARIIELSQGQAQFSVAKDAARTFKVIAGNQTIIAVGTVFTVEYVDREVHVAMLEGKVAVIPQSSPDFQPLSENPHPNPSPSEGGGGSKGWMRTGEEGVGVKNAQRGGEAIELSAGEALRVGQDGHATVTPRADLEAATAWRQGRVIFDGESLSEAVRRLNRYSHLQLEVVDPHLASLKISGVFEAGDTRAFADAIQSYLPIAADYSDSDTIKLKSK